MINPTSSISFQFDPTQKYIQDSMNLNIQTHLV